ncbi:MAG: ComEC/Rec2 family competence protein [Alphaproteobacteria bacterium]|nr:ComEC/Rec2 family competence protein [Alphaproteobacteria bacterium]
MMLISMQRRLVLWMPVWLAVGIILYFQLPAASLYFPTLESIMSIGLGYPLLWGTYRSLARSNWHGSVYINHGILIVLCVLAGFHMCALRTYIVAAPMIENPSYRSLAMDGIVVDEPMDSLSTLKVRVVSLETYAQERLPVYVRLHHKQSPLLVHKGDHIRCTVTLLPPSHPLIPGGFDFYRYAFYQQLGGIAFAKGPIEIVQSPLLKEWDQRWELRIKDHFFTVLGKDKGAIAFALLLGDTRGIDDELMNDIRQVGLAHLMAISGLNMVLVGLGAYMLVRRLLCLIPDRGSWKWKQIMAAFIAIVASGIYVWMVGFAVSAFRSYLMLVLFFIACIVNRFADSMTSLSATACFILIAWPEELWDPGFQMSFAATLGLIGYFEHRREKRKMAALAMEHNHLFLRCISFLFNETTMMLITTLLASLVTAPFSIYHFHQLSAYTLMANMIAGPLVALWVLPLLIIAACLPFPPVDTFLILWADKGIMLLKKTIIDISAWPKVHWHLYPMPTIAFAAYIIAMISYYWGPRNNKMPALACCMIATLVWWTAQQPDIILGEPSMKQFAVIDYLGHHLFVHDPVRQGFATQAWQQFLGLDDIQAMSTKAFDNQVMSYQCDQDQCSIRKAGQHIVIVKPGVKEALDCPKEADVIVNYSYPFMRCRHQQRLFNRNDLWDGGIKTLTINKRGVTLSYASFRESEGTAH